MRPPRAAPAVRAVPGADRVRRGVAQVRQLGAELCEAFNAVWRRSLQLRVVISTLALSTAVVLVLGLVLQTQIALRVLQGKEADTLARADAGRVLLERDLSGVDPDREGAQGDLNNALDRLTNAGADDEPASATAGEFRAVLTTGRGEGIAEVSAGPVEDVPLDLRDKVAQGTLSRKYVTLGEQGVEVPTLLVGQPVRTANGELEFYLLFPLTAEQRTLGLVQSTLIVGGLILLLLLAGIASLVTRQVVRPVRQAAEIAERFADGHLDERMPVLGEDEVARLGESYNEMAGSIQQQIRQLEEFGALQRRFTSDVSHELRTPLTTVRMAADVLYASREQLLPALRRSSELLVERARPVRVAARRPAGDQQARRRCRRAGRRARRHARRRGARRRGRARDRRRDGHAAGARPARPASTPRSTRAASSGSCATWWPTRSTTARAGPVRVVLGGDEQRGRGAGPRPRRRACARGRRSWCSTGSGGPRSRGPGAAAAAVWACRSASRTPGCTAAGCRPGARSGRGAAFRLTLPAHRGRRRHGQPAAAGTRAPPTPCRRADGIGPDAAARDAGARRCRRGRRGTTCPARGAGGARVRGRRSDPPPLGERPR